MSKSIGTFSDGRGGSVDVDLNRLIETRLLVEANSGGGKSWAIRKLLESTHGKVQHIVLDIEGDFGSLRESYDYILSGKDGDIPTDIRSAELLPRKVLELNASIIVDLYELKQHERIRYVKVFLESLINAPKKLWHPALIVIDEAHIFAPERGKAESLSAVVDIATRGRKRGFCVVLATQRLSKLDKDAAAECINTLIGRTSLDIDMKRAADVLGFSSRESMLSLRNLKPGEFYAFGPAFCTEVRKIQVGRVKTSHPGVGKRFSTPVPAATARIKSVLSQLSDLPAAAEKELRATGELRAKIRDLKRELRKRPAPEIDEQAIEKMARQFAKEAVRKLKSEWLGMLEGTLVNIDGIAKGLRSQIRDLAVPEIVVAVSDQEAQPSHYPADQFPIHPIKNLQCQNQELTTRSEKLDGALGRCERSMLSFLAMRPEAWFSKVQVGAMTGYSHKSGGFNNAISKVCKQGFVLRQGGKLKVDEAKIAEIESLLGSDFHEAGKGSLEGWLSKFGKCARVIYATLLNHPDASYSKEELGQVTGYSHASGGFNNALAKLCSLGLACRQHGGNISINREILDL